MLHCKMALLADNQWSCLAALARTEPQNPWEAVGRNRAALAGRPGFGEVSMRWPMIWSEIGFGIEATDI